MGTANKASKRVRGNTDKLGERQTLPLTEAVTTLKGTKGTRFDETFEVAINLGIDPKKGEQAVRGAVALPHGTGRKRSVIAFVKDPEKQAEALAAGAKEAGAEDLVKKVAEGWTGFDVAIAAPDMMGQVGKLGKVLGPQGKMPTPKAGTVTPKVADAVREFAAGKIEFRADAGGTVHAPVGKRSFDDDKLVENVRSLVDTLVAMKPATAKGTYIKQVFLTTTMGPSIAVDMAN